MLTLRSRSVLLADIGKIAEGDFFPNFNAPRAFNERAVPGLTGPALVRGEQLATLVSWPENPYCMSGNVRKCRSVHTDKAAWDLPQKKCLSVVLI